MTTVMVTATGAVIGYGILRSLRRMDRPLRLVAADIYPHAAGQLWADEFHQAPLTRSEGYAEWLRERLVASRVDLLIPGFEQDIQRYAEDPGLFDGLSCRVVLNRRPLIALCADKWLMHEQLAALASPVRIPSRIAGDFDELAAAFGVPFLLKPRRGSASKGLVRVDDRAVFETHRAGLGPLYLAQPYVGSADAEYTVGVFGDGRGGIRAAITLQRWLAPDGSTARAIVRREPELDTLVADLCAAFAPIGPTNLQFRRTEQGWKLLEINPRISSSTSIRTGFGYNEAALCVQHYVDGAEVVQPPLRSGCAIRYIEDAFFHDRDHL